MHVVSHSYQGGSNSFHAQNPFPNRISSTSKLGTRVCVHVLFLLEATFEVSPKFVPQIFQVEINLLLSPERTEKSSQIHAAGSSAQPVPDYEWLPLCQLHC